MERMRNRLFDLGDLPQWFPKMGSHNGFPRGEGARGFLMDLNGQIANLDRIFTEIIDHRHQDRNHMELFFPGGPPIGLNHQHFGAPVPQRFNQPEERKF